MDFLKMHHIQFLRIFFFRKIFSDELKTPNMDFLIKTLKNHRGLSTTFLSTHAEELVEP